MLPKLRLVVAAILLSMVAVVAGLSATGAIRITRNSANALESLRSGSAFDERLNWNQFSNPDSARRFQQMAARQDPTILIPDAAVPDEPAADATPGAAASSVATADPVMTADDIVAGIDRAVEADQVAVNVPPIEAGEAIPATVDETAKAPDTVAVTPVAPVAAQRMANLNPVVVDKALKPIARKKRVVRRHRRRSAAMRLRQPKPFQTIVPNKDKATFLKDKATFPFGPFFQGWSDSGQPHINFTSN